MDSIGLELWDAKREQHRDIRKSLYKQCLGTLNARGILQGGATIEQLYNVGTEYNGKLILNWRHFFHNYWERESPTQPSQVAETAKNEISTVIDEENKLIDEEIQDILTKTGITFNESNLASGKSRLHKSCEVLKKKCFAEIETLSRIRSANLSKEIREQIQHRRERQWDITAALFVAAVSAVMGAAAMNYFSREQTTIFKEQVGEISKLRGANASINTELSKLREDYRFLVKWTVKSPEQIEREITRLKEDLARRKQDIVREYAEKKSNYHSDMARRGLIDSSIHDGGIKELAEEEKMTLKKAELEILREIEDLSELKKKSQSL